MLKLKTNLGWLGFDHLGVDQLSCDHLGFDRLLVSVYRAEMYIVKSKCFACVFELIQRPSAHDRVSID